MKNFFSRQMQKLRHTHKPQPSYPPAWPLYDNSHAKPKMNSQVLCPLFNKLSGELRILIYEAVLADPSRFLHIMRNRRREAQENPNGRRVAHYWCEDEASTLPTWQHSCYGESLDVKPRMPTGWNSRATTETSDRMLSLILTCRLIYYEALQILYQGNIFHFRGANGLLAFHTSLPSVQWHAVRHIHISTWYGSEAGWGVEGQCWLPEDLLSWTKMGEHLTALPTLDSLRFDIVFDTANEWDIMPLNLMESYMIKAFKPLREARARFFEVETNIPPSEKVWMALGDVNFVIVVRERDWDTNYYGEYPRLSL